MSKLEIKSDKEWTDFCASRPILSFFVTSQIGCFYTLTQFYQSDGINCVVWIKKKKKFLVLSFSFVVTGEVTILQYLEVSVTSKLQIPIIYTRSILTCE